jgi:hypothetical protein
MMHTERPRYDNPLHEDFFKACKAIGIPANPDFNDWSRPQVGPCTQGAQWSRGGPSVTGLNPSDIVQRSDERLYTSGPRLGRISSQAMGQCFSRAAVHNEQELADGQVTGTQDILSKVSCGSERRRGRGRREGGRLSGKGSCRPLAESLQPHP